MEAYVELLLSWNAKLNLVSASQASRQQVRCRPGVPFSRRPVGARLLRRRLPYGAFLTRALAAQIMTRHVEDALSLLPCITAALPDPDASVSVVDVGSGAGFPGMVLAISRPKWRVTLVDSLAKRVSFLEDVTARAPVPNAHALWGRAEDVGRDGALREQFDVAVARAVAELRCAPSSACRVACHADAQPLPLRNRIASVLSELCLPLVRVGGVWVAQKGADPELEVADAKRAVSILGGGAMTVQRVATLGPDGRPFTAVLCPKLRACGVAYPREAGTPKRLPL